MRDTRLVYLAFHWAISHTFTATVSTTFAYTVKNDNKLNTKPWSSQGTQTETTLKHQKNDTLISDKTQDRYDRIAINSVRDLKSNHHKWVHVHRFDGTN